MVTFISIIPFCIPCRLSIASAHAFLLVYSVTDPLSFVTVKQRFEEIKEQRPDYQVQNVLILTSENCSLLSCYIRRYQL